MLTKSIDQSPHSASSKGSSAAEDSQRKFHEASATAKADHARNGKSGGRKPGPTNENRKGVALKSGGDSKKSAAGDQDKSEGAKIAANLGALAPKIQQARDESGSDGNARGPGSESEFRHIAKQKGWTVLEADDAPPPTSKIDPSRANQTTITYKYKGKTYAVSNFVSPFKFTAIESRLAGQQISQSDNNININVPQSEATDFMQAKTTVDDKTVNELFNKNMEDAWSKLGLDDKRRQYYELIRAKASLTDGYKFLPNQTFDTSPSDSTNISDNPVTMDSGNRYGLLNEKQIAKKLAKLAQDQDIVDGVDKFMVDAADKIKDKKGLTNKVYDTMNSDKYQSLLKNMDSDGAKARFNNDLKSLQYLAPKKAQEIRDKFLDQGLGDNLADRIENQKYSDDDLKLAVQDEVKVGLQATYTSYFGVIFTDRAVQNYLKTGKGELPADTKKALDTYKSSLKIISKSIVDSVKAKGQFDLKDVSSRLSGELKSGMSGKGPAAKAGVASVFKLMMKNGVIPSFAGITTASAAAYALSKNKGETTEDRMAAARQLLITVATSPALTKHAAQIFGKIFNKPGMDTMLGLDGQNTQLRETFLKLFPKANDDIPNPGTSDNILGETGLDPEPANGNPDVADKNLKSWFNDGASESDHRSTLSGASPALDKSDSPLANTMQSWIADADTNSELSDRMTSWLDDPDNVSGLRSDVSGLVDDVDRNSPLGNTLGSWLDDASSDADVADNMRSWLDDAGSGSDPEDRTKAVTSWLDDVSSGDIPLRSDSHSSSQLGDLYENANERIGDAQNDLSSNLENAYENASAADRANMMDTMDARLRDQGIDPDKMNTQGKLRIVGSSLTVFANVGDVAGGVLDLALGVMSLDRLADDPDALNSEKAVASLQLLGGSSIAGMAGTNLASMMAGARVATMLGRVSGTLGVAGAGFGALTMIVMAFMVQKKKEQALEKERQDFRDWDTLGVAADDWGDKFNYVQNARMAYGGDLQVHPGQYDKMYPADQPMWKARPEQYKDFSQYVKEHGGVSVLWFKNWDEAHSDLAFPDKPVPDSSGRPRLGQPDHSAPTHFDWVHVGSFNEFRTDIDRVDIGSIEMADSGRILFTKDGVKQVIDSHPGGELKDSDRKKIYAYLKNLYQLVHPDGKLDKGLVKKADDILGKTDKYNDIDDLKRYLDPNLLPVVGKDGGAPGTFRDFRQDIDRVDVGSIELDSQDSSVIKFKKDGKEWKLDKDNHGDMTDLNARNTFNYLKKLHDITHADGELDQKLADKINGLHKKSDGYNSIDDLESKLGSDLDPSGLPVFGNQGGPGTFSDFAEDIDKVDVGKIQVLDDGRVIFVKNGVKQIINPDVGHDTHEETRSEIVDYLKGLNKLTHPGGEYSQDRADQINRILGRTDHYNSLDDLRGYVDRPAPAAWNEDPHDVTIFYGAGTIGDFKQDMDKVDVASIREKDGSYYFKKQGKWYEISKDHDFDDFDYFAGYLHAIYSITHDGDGKLDKSLATEMDDLFSKTDDYNEIDDLNKYFGFG